MKKAGMKRNIGVKGCVVLHGDFTKREEGKGWGKECNGLVKS